jgi:hypothetical protein
MLETRKTFVTGVYGSGKTSFAMRYARENGIPYFDFDRLHRYDASGKQSDQILRSLPDRFAIDAIPIDEKGKWGDFREYEARNDVFVVCVFCPDRSVWLRRVQQKVDMESPKRGIKETVKRWLRWAGLRPEEPLSIDVDFHLQKYRNFFAQNVPLLSGFRHVRYYDSCSNEYTSREEMLERIRFRYFPLEDHLDGLGKDHDKKYQDIEILGMVGYTESYKTWERIRDLVDWRGKRVADLGCFHGYFCFKVEDAGGTATGLDRSPTVLEVARRINELRGGRVVFWEWVGGDDLPECDVVLCLNVLHHFKDPETAVSKMRSREAVFEIKGECRALVEKYFTVRKEVGSHRKDRCILLCARRGA